jgi:hypothetical protein
MQAPLIFPEVCDFGCFEAVFHDRRQRVDIPPLAVHRDLASTWSRSVATQFKVRGPIANNTGRRPFEPCLSFTENTAKHRLTLLQISVDNLQT